MTIYFNDIEQHFPQTVGEYRMTEGDIVEYARKWDPHPFHLEAEAAEQSAFGRLTASSRHTLSAVSLLFHQLEDMALIAGLGEEYEILQPVFVDDCLSVRLTFVEKRQSRSKPDRGIATLAYQALNQRSEVVLKGSMKVMLAVKRSPVTPFPIKQESSDS